MAAGSTEAEAVHATDLKTNFEKYRKCNLCENPLTTHHKVKDSALIALLSSHASASKLEALSTKKCLVVCCRHFRLNHSPRMKGKQMEQALKDDFLLTDFTGPMIYSCKASAPAPPRTKRQRAAEHQRPLPAPEPLQSPPAPRSIPSLCLDQLSYQIPKYL